MIQRGKGQDGVYREIVSDAMTQGLQVITTDHAAIHASEGFSISGIFAGVANGATVNYAFKTPSVASGKYIHLKFKEFSATANKIRVDLYENPTNGTKNKEAR